MRQQTLNIQLSYFQLNGGALPDFNKTIEERLFSSCKIRSVLKILIRTGIIKIIRNASVVTWFKCEIKENSLDVWLCLFPASLLNGWE